MTETAEQAVIAMPPPPLAEGMTIGPENETPAEPDYFGASQKTEHWYLPGSQTQAIIFKVMNEGDRKKWQKRTSREVRVNREEKNVAITNDIAGDREALFMATIIGWSLLKNGVVAKFSIEGPGSEFMKWCNSQDPELIDKLEIAIRDAHPWMQDEMDSESIQEEIDRLYKLKERALEREAAKANF